MHDLAVIGLGLIGSASLRHGAAAASVIGIGPDEPNDWSTHGGPFASHYDSGRITRRIDAKRQWAVLASRAIEQYPLLEERTGVDFHVANGVAFVRNDQIGINRLTSVAADLSIPIEVGSVSSTLSDIPLLSLPVDFTVIREGEPAGAVDPRRMRQAQIQAAIDDGAIVINEAAVSVSETDRGFEVTTGSGETYEARRALLATGAYTADLIGEQPAVAVRPEAVVLGEVTESEAQRFRLMPSVLYLLEHALLDDVYVVPPARYPDGRWYIKIGGSQRHAPLLADTSAMNRSMQQGQTGDQVQAMRRVLEEMLPDAQFRGWQSKPCLITDTESGLPYVDRLDNGMTVAFGGNGHAAKSSDALGALAVGLALNERWSDEELAAEDFTVRFGVHNPPDGSRHGS